MADPATRFTVGNSALESALNLSQDAVLIANRNGSLEWSNAMFRRIFGYDHEDLAGETLWSWKGSDRGESADRVEQQLRNGASWSGQTRVRHKNGSLLLLNETIAPVLDDRCGVASFVSVLRKGDALFQTQGTLRAIIASSPIATIAIDADLNVQIWNDAACRIFGWTEEEVLGRALPPALFESGSDASGFAAAVGQVESMSARSFVGSRRDGTVVHLSVWSFPLQGNDGNLAGLILTMVDVTERNRMQAALREAEENLRVILDAIPIRVFWKDMDSRFLGCNSIFCRDAGMSSPAELIGKSDHEMPWSHYAGVFRADDQEVISSGRPKLNYELVYNAPDGRKSYLIGNKLPLTGSDGHLRGVIGTYVDVTKQKLAEQELAKTTGTLQEEKAFTDSVLATLPGIVYCFDENRRFIRWNAAFETQLGFSREEILEMDFLGTIHPDDRAAAAESIERTHRDGRASVEVRIRDTAGRPSWFFCTAVRRELQGSPYIIGVGIDITERKHAEMALLETEERFRTIVEMAPDGIFIATETGEIVHANTAGCEMLRYGRETLIGTNVISVVVPRFQNRLRERLRLGFPDAGMSYESCHQTSDGHEFPVEVNVRPVNFRGRRALLAIVRDTTDRKRAEGERARLEEQLQHAQKLESVGRLAGGIAHDFNNLLTVVNGYSDLLLNIATLDAHARAQVRVIRKAGDRAVSLVQQLLAFSRRQFAEPKPLNLNVVVSEAQEMLRRVLGENIQTNLELEPELGVVIADPGQMHQVLMNLLLNARDAMPIGGTLTIRTANVELPADAGPQEEEASAGSCVRLVVADTGVGMTDDVRQHVFEPFFTTKDPGAGTGLGLSTVYGIVKQNNGWIRVASVSGTGTTFTIDLPRVSEPVSDEAPAPSVAVARGSETILVAEDQEDVRDLAAQILRSHGYAVLAAPDAENALLLAKQHSGAIHLLLTDVVMPGMTGVELAESLKPLHPKMKVLFTSGYGETVIAHRGVLHAGTEYLPKPFTPSALATKVRQVLGPMKPAARVLIVDDDEGVRRLFRDILEPEGYQVDLASNGETAARTMDLKEFDLVITDLVMPEREGIETIQEIRRTHPRVRIIAISGAFGGWFLDVATKLGADATLSKPVHPDKLLETIRNVIAS